MRCPACGNENRFKPHRLRPRSSRGAEHGQPSEGRTAWIVGAELNPHIRRGSSKSWVPYPESCPFDGLHDSTSKSGLSAAGDRSGANRVAIVRESPACSGCYRRRVCHSSTLPGAFDTEKRKGCAKKMRTAPTFTALGPTGSTGHAGSATGASPQKSCNPTVPRVKRLTFRTAHVHFCPFPALSFLSVNEVRKGCLDESRAGCVNGWSQDGWVGLVTLWFRWRPRRSRV
jgi:hypothetical protein